MEKDKLYKQASLAAYNYANPDGDDPCLDMDFYEGFKQGAEWLQSQPIAERLTEEERKKLTPANRYVLEKIFGKGNV